MPPKLFPVLRLPLLHVASTSEPAKNKEYSRNYNDNGSTIILLHQFKVIALCQVPWCVVVVDDVVVAVVVIGVVVVVVIVAVVDSVVTIFHRIKINPQEKS